MSNTATPTPFRLYVRTQPEGLLVRITRQFRTFGMAWRYARSLNNVLNAELRQTTPTGGERLVDEFEVVNGHMTRTYTGEAL